MGALWWVYVFISKRGYECKPEVKNVMMPAVASSFREQFQFPPRGRGGGGWYNRGEEYLKRHLAPLLQASAPPLPATFCLLAAGPLQNSCALLQSLHLLPAAPLQHPPLCDSEST